MIREIAKLLIILFIITVLPSTVCANDFPQQLPPSDSVIKIDNLTFPMDGKNLTRSQLRQMEEDVIKLNVILKTNRQNVDINQQFKDKKITPERYISNLISEYHQLRMTRIANLQKDLKNKYSQIGGMTKFYQNRYLDYTNGKINTSEYLEILETTNASLDNVLAMVATQDKEVMEKNSNQKVLSGLANIGYETKKSNNNIEIIIYLLLISMFLLIFALTFNGFNITTYAISYQEKN